MTIHQDTKPKDESRDDWETPDDLFRLLNLEFGFGIDVAASDVNHKLPAYFQLDDDGARNGLERNWHHYRGPWWCNPPYSDIAAWVAKAIHETRIGHPGVMLLPANRTDQAWWHELVLPAIESGLIRIRYIRGRLRFKGAKHSAQYASLLLIFGRQQ